MVQETLEVLHLTKLYDDMSIKFDLIKSCKILTLKDDKDINNF